MKTVIGKCTPFQFAFQKCHFKFVNEALFSYYLSSTILKHRHVINLQIFRCFGAVHFKENTFSLTYVWGFSFPIVFDFQKIFCGKKLNAVEPLVYCHIWDMAFDT